MAKNLGPGCWIIQPERSKPMTEPGMEYMDPQPKRSGSQGTVHTETGVQTWPADERIDVLEADLADIMEERDRLREQLRLAHIDAMNEGAENARLREALEDVLDEVGPCEQDEAGRPWCVAHHARLPCAVAAGRAALEPAASPPAEGRG